MQIAALMHVDCHPHNFLTMVLRTHCGLMMTYEVIELAPHWCIRRAPSYYPNNKLEEQIAVFFI